MSNFGSEQLLKDEIANKAVQTLNKRSHFLVATIILTGTLSAIAVALTQQPTIPETNDHPIVVIAVTVTTAIFLAAFFAALLSGIFIYTFIALNSATRKAKRDIEELVAHGVIKIITSHKNKTVIWSALDVDAADSSMGREIQRSGAVGGFFPRHLLEKLSGTSKV